MGSFCLRWWKDEIRSPVGPKPATQSRAVFGHGFSCASGAAAIGQAGEPCGFRMM